MINDEILNQIFENRQESIEKNISQEYHKRIKQIQEKDEGERNNIKMGILSELYYKQGFIDGINFIMNNIQKNRKIFINNWPNSLQNKD